jgi:hypothetical protein
MKKQYLCLRSLLLVAFLMAGSKSWAQKDTTTWMSQVEYRVHDEGIFKKNFSDFRSYWRKADPGEHSRIAYTSESGRIYSLAFFVGPDDMGSFMANWKRISDEFVKKYTALSNEESKNTNGAITRSIWVRENSMSRVIPGYKLEDFRFRKILIFTVNPDKIKEFEDAERKLAEMDEANGLIYTHVIFRCVEGYPSNTYLLLLPDKSLMDYYKHHEARNAKRVEKKSDYDPVNKAVSDLSLISRIDHLTEVDWQ